MRWGWNRDCQCGHRNWDHEFDRPLRRVFCGPCMYAWVQTGKDDDITAPGWPLHAVRPRTTGKR